MLRTAFVCVVPFVAVAVGCSPAPVKEGSFPPRPAGCDIKVYPEAPPEQTDNIGPVSSSCADTVSDDDCLRTMKDEACKLGADIVWGVTLNPTPQAGKKKFFGRAAHSHVATPPKPQ